MFLYKFISQMVHFLGLHFPKFSLHLINQVLFLHQNYISMSRSCLDLIQQQREEVLILFLLKKQFIIQKKEQLCCPPRKFQFRITKLLPKLVKRKLSLSVIIIKVKKVARGKRSKRSECFQQVYFKLNGVFKISV